MDELLEDIQSFIEGFIYFEKRAQSTAVTLWIVGTYVFDAYDVTPYLHIKSPEKRSGKSLLLEILELLCSTPILAANVSPAALYRVVQLKRPTILLDEVDAVFPKGRAAGDPAKEDLRGLLNAGYRSSGTAMRVNLRKSDELETYSTFSPKALAGIGDLPDTIADRCVVIALQRKPRSVVVERFRRRLVSPRAEDLAARIREVTDGLVETLRGMHPHLPHQLNDREQDTWELLFAVADHAGGGWPDDARKAAVDLSGDAVDASETVGQRLLADLQACWGDDDGLATTEILSRLHALDESPWGDWYGRPYNARDLAKALKPYGISSADVWTGSKSLKGYKREHLVPVWERYTTQEVGEKSEKSENVDAPTVSHPRVIRELRARADATRGQLADNSRTANVDAPTVLADLADIAPPPTEEPADLYSDPDDWWSQ